jgi:hypothetical protein
MFFSVCSFKLFVISTKTLLTTRGIYEQVKPFLDSLLKVLNMYLFFFCIMKFENLEVRIKNQAAMPNTGTSES